MQAHLMQKISEKYALSVALPFYDTRIRYVSIGHRPDHPVGLSFLSGSLRSKPSYTACSDPSISVAPTTF